jgi:ADP-heptose:LPS heptosyltransferase
MGGISLPFHIDHFPSPRDGSAMGKVLVIRGGALGDFLLTLPTIRLLKDGLPAATIEVLGYHPMVELATLTGAAHATRPLGHAGLAGFFVPGAKLDPGWSEYFAGFDVIFSFLPDADGHLKDNMLRAGVKTWFQGKWKVDESPGAGHAAEQLAEVCQNLALWLEDPAPMVRVPHPPGERSGLAIHPGSGSPRKSWLFGRWAEAGPELARLLSPGECLEVISGEAEEEWIGDLLAQWRGLPVRHHRFLSLGKIADLLAGCRGYLGHDTGVSHLAAACGIPCLLLFGPTNPEIWAPRNPGARVLRAPGGHLDQLAVGPVIEGTRVMMGSC